MEKKLLEWFNKTGYPLELWTESILSKYKFQTVNSALYKDEENDIFREIDLTASRAWYKSDKDPSISINLIIECKKSDKPFVLLSNKNQEIPKANFNNYYGTKDFVTRILFGNNSTSIDLPGKSSNGFKLTQGFVKGDETCHKAINTIIKSFIDYLKNEEENLEFFVEHNDHSLTLPILLIDAPFYELRTDENEKLQIEKIDSGVISSITHLSKFYPDSFPIPIITKDSFEEFIKGIEKSGAGILSHLIKNPMCTFKNIENSKLVLTDRE